MNIRSTLIPDVLLAEPQVFGDAPEVFDVAVDLRWDSRTLGRSAGEVLSELNRRQLWILEGFAHGFVVLSETAEFLYKTTDYCFPEHEHCIRWDDADPKIAWPLSAPPLVSAKNAAGQLFRDAPLFQRLPPGSPT